MENGSSITMEEENIQVVVRIRPLMTIEKKAGEFAVVEANSNGREVQVKVNLSKCVMFLQQIRIDFGILDRSVRSSELSM